MPLLVVPLAPENTGALTLRELELLRSRATVYFEVADHPLEELLRKEGVQVRPLSEDLPFDRNDSVLVADPASQRVVDLARAGAEVVDGFLDAPDPLTAAHGAKVVRNASSALARFVAIMARLRSEDGCPWDREQTHKSLQVHLIEEAHEVLDVIDRNELGAELEEELGDLLLQVAFHSQLALDDGRFDLGDVANAISGKLVDRHPHVFGDVTVSGASEVVRNWEAIKAQEKARSDPFDDIPAGLPALLAAYKTQKRAAGLGFRAEADAARSNLEHSLEGEIDEDSLGDALFWLVAVARATGIDPEGALRAATRRFREQLG